MVGMHPGAKSAMWQCSPPTPVQRPAEQHPVHVTRRDGDDLVLMSKREADERERLLKLAAQFLAASTDDTCTLAQRFADRLP